MCRRVLGAVCRRWERAHDTAATAASGLIDLLKGNGVGRGGGRGGKDYSGSGSSSRSVVVVMNRAGAIIPGLVGSRAQLSCLAPAKNTDNWDSGGV